MFTYQNYSVGFAALLLAFGLAACSSAEGGGHSSSKTVPTVVSTFPSDNAQQVALNTNIIARFSEAMNASTISTTTFKLTGPGATPVAGSVTYDVPNDVADFF